MSNESKEISEASREDRKAIRLLLVEDNPGDADLICEILDEDPSRVFTVEAVSRLADACVRLKSAPIDAVLLDLGLPDSTGLDTLRSLGTGSFDVPVIVLTGLDDEAIGLAAVTEGAQDYLVKGQITSALVRRVIQFAVERARTQRNVRESEQRFRSIFDSMASGMAIYEPVDDGRDFVFKDINPAGARMANRTREEHIGRRIAEVYPRVRDMGLFDILQQVLRDGQPRRHPVALYEDTRIQLWVENYVCKLASGDIVALYEDVTAQHEAEERERLAHEVLALLNRPGIAVELVGDILRLVRETLQFDAVGIRLREGEDYPYFETSGFSKDFLRTERFLCARDESGNLVRDAAGNAILECMCGAVLRGRTDPKLPFFTEGGSFWTSSSTQLLASTQEADRQSRTRNRCNGEGYKSVALIPLRSGNDIIGVLQLNDRRQNRLTPELVHFFEGLGASIGIAVARMQTEESLRASEAKFRSIVDSIGLGVMMIDKDLKVLDMNRKMREWYPDVNPDAHPVCYTLLEDLPGAGPCKGCPTARTLRDGKIHEAKRIVASKSGDKTYRVVSSAVHDAQGDVVAAIEIVEDITGQLALEEQLRQAQKMEAVGQLAGGVAHDFNNILQAMVGYSGMLLDRFDEGTSEHEFVTEIADGADRASRLTRQLLAFSRRQILELEDIDLNDVVLGLTKMIRRVIGENIQVDFTPGHSLATIHADRGQMEQVLLNLCINARDAMPVGGGLGIETENVVLDQAYCETHTWAIPGRYVLLSVTDSGCGMNEETQSRIFDPFFTTKELGKGTGLGLATVYGIIRQHNGMIQVYSEVGRGTALKIYVPAIERAASVVGRKVTGRVVGGSETILVAEDDETLRSLASRILAGAGYTVLLAGDGEKALQVYADYEGDIALVLLDVVMPKLGGRAVFDILSKRRPELRFIFSSGYSVNAVHTDFVLDAGIEFLQKPYAPDALLRKIREVLDKEP